MRKILSVFRTTSIDIMKIECNLLPPKLRLLQKNQKYILRLTKIEKHNILFTKIPNTLTRKFEKSGFDEDVGNNKFAKGNESHPKKPLPSQLFRIFYSMSPIFSKNMNLEPSPKFEKSWKNFILSNVFLYDREIVQNKFYEVTKHGYNNKFCSFKLIFYSDSSLNEKKTFAGTIFVPKPNAYFDLKKNLEKSNILCSDNIKTFGKNGNLGQDLSILIAELYVIFKSTIGALKMIQKNYFHKNIWVFTDNKSAVQSIINVKKLGISKGIRKNIKELYQRRYTLNIQGIPGHKGIQGNELTD